MRAIPGNPLTVLEHRHLLGQLVRRDVLLRYRGAYLGVLWVILNPLVMLAIYTFILSQVFATRWAGQGGDLPLALGLFTGLIAFNLFAETVARAPMAVRSQPSYVKKIIFPVEVLPVVPLGAALVQAGCNLVILAAALAWTGNLHAGLALYPLLLLPLLVLAIGLSWFFAAWGVFIKDLTQVVPVLMQMLFFLSPVLYTSSMLPESVRALAVYNPVGAVIEACRAAVTGAPVPWAPWGLALAVGVVAAVAGRMMFDHARDEFADVL